MTRSRSHEVALAAFAGLAAVAASLLVAGLGRGFVVLPVDRFIINQVPGRLISEVIVTVGPLGHVLHQLPALGIAVALLGAAAWLGLVVAYRRDGRLLGGVVATGGVTLLAGLVTGVWPPAGAAGVAAGLVVTLAPVGGTELQRVSVERRSVMRGAAGAAALLGLGGVTRVLVADDEPPAPLPEGREEVESMLATAEERSFDVAGMDGLVSGDHYEVDINNLANPSVSTDGWSLSVTGEVAREREFDYEELRGMATEHRYATLRCVSDTLNGQYMDTAVWSGVPASEVLAAAEPRSGCGCVMLHAVDGYSVEFPLAALRQGLLAYGMNGRFLPEGHGYPLRALVPGHWGETHAKWLTEIEVLDEPAEGYWESPPRNWEGTGVVETIAKLHARQRRGGDRVLLAGHAYAGARGVDRVEVSMDGGETWETAELTERLPTGDRDVWRMWRLEVAVPGPTEVTVRAVDGTGTVQPREESPPYPDGASGWVTREIG